MANLIVGNLQGGTGTTITMEPGSRIAAAKEGGIYAPGMIIQTVWVASSKRMTYTSPASGDGQPIYELEMTIAPRRSNSIIYCQYMINYEMHYDNVFTFYKNRGLIGYNTQVGNVNYSGVAAALYDQDQSSTPSNLYMSWYDSPGTTSSVTYGPGVRCSTGTTYTFCLNRTLSSIGTDSYETGTSMGVIMEIAQ